MKITTKRIISLALAVVLLFTAVFVGYSIYRKDHPSLRSSSRSIYANEENWAYLGVGEDRKVDLFIVCPTVDMGKAGNYNMSLTDESTKEKFVGALNMERGIYEDDCRMFSPFYRQAAFTVYSLESNEAAKYFDIAYKDVKDAFLYYLNHYNEGRPIVLAGFSQGSDMILRLMEDLYRVESLRDKLVAAYAIGWRITEKDLQTYPHLKMAQGEKDTGVIISFSSEAKGVKESIIIPKGVKTLAINPLNWKTDSTKANKNLNLGACFTNYSGNIKNEVLNLTGAYIDEDRGSLICMDINSKDYENSLFPNGVYHLYDYQFFYRNLQENVSLRIDEYLKNTKA